MVQEPTTLVVLFGPKRVFPDKTFEQDAHCVPVRNSALRQFLLDELNRPEFIFAVLAYQGKAYGIKLTSPTEYTKVELSPDHEYALYALKGVPQDAGHTHSEDSGVDQGAGGRPADGHQGVLGQLRLV